ncbi:unnamed protein product, partial [Mesorhabditis belari]|uniref:Integrase catalytic domain-containing protein n=1 Tax=Mesorhabditis belari TaxID=2138241 RepID=A0AAF3ESA0_9BILA
MEIFGTFGAPKILQSDNGKEFANRLVKELVNRWPSCRIMHGRPRHSQSQGSVERANQDVEKILCTQLREQQSTRWARILPIVQSTLSPGHWAITLRSNVWSKNATWVPDQEDVEIIDWSESIRGAITDNPTFFPETDDEEDAIAIAKEKEGDFVQRDKEIWHHRNGAALQQQKQAENMLEKSKNRFGAVEVGQTVRLPIDAVDRPKIDHSTLFGVVMEENQGFYQIGTTNGILQQKLTRNQFEPANNNFLSFKEVPQVESTFRAAVGSQSLTGTQADATRATPARISAFSTIEENETLGGGPVPEKEESEAVKFWFSWNAVLFGHGSSE